MSAPIFEFRALPVRRIQPSLYAGPGKRIFDITVVIALLPVVLPLLAVILGITALRGGNPLYAQLRVGLDGRVFRCWKVRTMIRGAEAELERLVASDPALAAEWAINQKLSRDPRITRFGAILRRSSLDELPQLWNVLTGTMSLVGPRPFTPEQRHIYSGGARDAAYFRMRPGITGLWQISRRNLGTFAERAVYDTDYWRSLTFAGDIVILVRTALVVIRGTGV